MAVYPATVPPEEDVAGGLEEMLRQHRRLGVDGCKDTWERAKTLQEFANGEQWPEMDKRRMDDPARKAPRLSVNEIGPILQTLSGRQMMQRFDREYLPRNSEWAARAEAMTKVDRALMEACDAEQSESAAFKDGPGVGGVSWLRFYLDSLDADTPEQLVVRDVPVWGMIWDPNAREINLRDRTFHRLQEAWPAAEVKAKWGDIIYRKARAAAGQPWTAEEIGKSSRIPWAGQDGNRPLDLRDEKRENVLWIDYEEWKSSERVYLVAQPQDPAQPYQDAAAASSRLPPAMPGQPPPEDPMKAVELDDKELSEYKKQYKATHGEDFPKEAISPRTKVCFYYAYLCGDTILETDKLKVGRFTLTAMTGFRFPGPRKTRFVGLVERLVDAQKWNNVLISALARNIQISPKGSLMLEEGWFKNKAQALADWSSPGAVLTVPRGTLSSGRKGYEVISAGGTAAYSQMVESLLGLYKDAIPRLAGFNPASLGQLGNDLKRVSGVVVRSVQDAAMTSNAELFDSLRLYRKEAGRIILAFLRTYFEVEDVIRVIGEDAAYQQQPVIDPQTGQPATDPQTGQPQMQQVLVVPDKDFWAPDAWKGIAVEEVVPAGDALQDLWEGLTSSGSLPVLLQPRQDIGDSIFSSEDLVELFPYVPAPRREKMRQRVARLTAQVQAQAQKPPDPPPPKVSVSIKAPYDPAGEPTVASAMGMSAQQAAQQQPVAPPPDGGGGQQAPQ